MATDMVADAIHVVPQRGGGWEVRSEASPRPLSEHATETEAERAAAAAARDLRIARVVVHDRYARVRLVPAGRAGR